MFIPALSADWTASEYIYATGGIHSNIDIENTDGTNLKSVWGPNAGLFQQVTAASQYVTGPGISEMDLSSSLGSEYKSVSQISYTGGGAVWDTLAVNSMTPNESELACTASDVVYTGTDTITGSIPDHVQAVGMTGAQGPNGVYISDKLTDPDIYALSSQFKGQGMYHADFVTGTELGHDKDSATLQHIDENRRHQFASSNLTGGISAKIDYTVNLADFSDPFGLTPANQTHITEEINQTAAGEVANATEEA
ncbi:MAG: hypothetical protein M0Q91_10065 [Methanoregula sp.]|nr:hypothetical protein [Methanoregula sp.]